VLFNVIPYFHFAQDDLFAKVAVSVIENHDAAGSAPMFLFFAPHNVHEPLQVPQWYMTHFDFIDYEPRQKYLAMVAHLDDVIGSLVTSLVAKGMWNDTLLVVSSDNGGPIYNNGNAGANNWPLHGGKVRYRRLAHAMLNELEGPPFSAG